jgi:spore coat polysaccharide biosynthesis predicted glycosyltransferase SpsG
MSRAHRHSTSRYLRQRVLFRADASHEIGFGHLARLFALIEEVEACGGEPVVMFGGDPPAVTSWARDRGLTVNVQPWTAAQVLQVVEDRKVVTAFLDGSRLVDELGAKLVERKVRTIVLDDQGGCALPVQAIVNHNVDAPLRAHTYPGARLLLLGRRYLLLRREIRRHMRGSCLPQQTARLRVVVTFGGSDPVGATARALRVMPTERALDLVVIAGPGFRGVDELRAAVDRATVCGHTVDLRRSPEDPGALFASADAAICSAGGTLGELAYLGCPAAAYAIVPDQRGPAAHQATAGLIHGGTDWGALTDDQLRADLRVFLEDDGRRKALRAAALSTADSDGPRRVVDEAVLELPA